MTASRALPVPLLFDDLPTMRAAPAGASLSADAWRPASWPFVSPMAAPLVPQRYRLIMADPAWEFALRSPKGEGKAPQKHYRCMPLDDIKAMPVRQLAHPDGCLLWLWGTWPMARWAFEVIDAWGFTYVTGAPWVKTTKHGKRAFGPGYVLRECTEFFLLARSGDPPYGPGCKSERGLLETQAFDDGEPLAIEAKVRGHSRKPDEQYAKARRLIPHGPACELFARPGQGSRCGATKPTCSRRRAGPDPPPNAYPLPAPHPDLRGTASKVPAEEQS